MPFPRVIRCALVLILLCATTIVTAQPAVELSPVTVTGTRLERALGSTPNAVSLVEGTALATARLGLQLDESLRRVPGLVLQNRFNFAQGQRISSRGFGARAPFGVRGIRIVLDGFPETVPDGQSQLDAIDLDAAQRIEVLRGPASVLYGNASGGVIAITSRDGRDSATQAGVSQRWGSDGLLKTAAHGGGSQESWFGHTSLSHLEYSGFRPQSAVRKTLFSGQLGYQLTADRVLRLSLAVLDLPRAQDPGGLSREQLTTGRRQATPLAIALDAGEAVSQQRLGLSFTDQAIGGGQIRLAGFASQRDFVQQLPFPGPSRPSFERDFFGASVDYQRPWQQGRFAGRWHLGLEAQRQQDQRLRESVNGSAQVTGVTQRERQNAEFAAVFGQFDLTLAAWQLSLGLRHDRLQLEIADQLLSDGDASGQRRFDELSYSLGLVRQLPGRQRMFATVGSAFESPTFTEFANPDGSAGFNPALEPQQALNREIGIGGPLPAALDYSISAYSIRVDDEITPFDLGGQSFFQNAARTERDGVELALHWQPNGPWGADLAYTYADYRYARFVDESGADLAGRRLPGQPRHLLFAEWRWQPTPNWLAALDAQWIGDVFAENQNQERVAGYALLNLRGQWAVPVDARTRLQLFAGVSNLLDRRYFANLRINANANRPLEQRGFFEPGPGIGGFIGIRLDLS